MILESAPKRISGMERIPLQIFSVSATPMLADNPFKQLRIIAKFLNRETEFYGIDSSKGKYVRKEDTLKFEPYPLLDKSCDATPSTNTETSTTKNVSLGGTSNTEKSLILYVEN